MSATSFAGSKIAVRDDLAESHRRSWAAIATPGTWLTGARRVAVAAEIRKLALQHERSTCGNVNDTPAAT